MLLCVQNDFQFHSLYVAFMLHRAGGKFKVCCESWFVPELMIQGCKCDQKLKGGHVAHTVKPVLSATQK